MNVLIATLVLSLFVGALFFAGLGIRILLKKDGKFRGTCASQSPFLKSELGECSVCGKTVGDGECGKDDGKKKENPLSAAGSIFNPKFK